jgi:hypothetical protein
LEEGFGIPPEALWQIAHPSPPRLDSQIISRFPGIFAEFRGRRFRILWRGGRDGFKAKDFHRRCDGRANTLTVILDTKGNIFGGFTPLECDSAGSYKADGTWRSFLFTLKNPHNLPPSRFALKARNTYRAIYCDPELGTRFCDIGIADDCNANCES